MITISTTIGIFSSGSNLMAAKPSYPVFAIMHIRHTHLSAVETKVAMKLRRYLVNECGLAKHSVTSMSYWRQGKANG